MQDFWLSTGIVALAEMGDKTQLLTLILAARFGRPLLICFGILLATLLNHAAAGALGAWLGSALTDEVLRWVLGISFLAMAGWMLIPDELDDVQVETGRWGVLITTVVVFFIAEMGDKTQLATVALAARSEWLWAVVAGTTLGMMLANVPAVYVGQQLAERLPVRRLNQLAAALFAGLGIWALMG